MICSRCKREFTSPSYKTCETCRIYNKNIRDKIERTYKQMMEKINSVLTV